MNSIVVLQICSVVIDIALIAGIVWKYWRSKIAQAWIVSYFFITGWAVCDLFQNIASTPATSLLWSRGTDATAVLASGFLLRFIFISIYPEFMKRRLIVWGYLSLAVLAAVIVTVTPFSTYETVKTWWGYYPHHAIGFYILNTYVVISGVFILLLPLYNFKSLNDQQQKQMRIFIVSFMIPIIGGTVSEVIIPAIGMQTPPLTTILFSITGVSMAYAIWKYHFLSFTPGLLLKEIFNTIKDIIIVIDANSGITLANSKFSKITSMTSEKLLGVPIQKVLYEVRGQLLSNDFFWKSPIHNRRMFVNSGDSAANDVPIMLDCVTILDGDSLQGAVLYGRDMTQMDLLLEELQKKTIDLESSKKQLESRVQEIEKFNTIMVGRELKMAEMKKDMEALQAKIASSTSH